MTADDERDSRRARLIERAATLPEVVVEPSGDAGQHLSLTVRKKRIAWYLHDHQGDDITALSCKAPPGANTDLVAGDPDRYFLPDYLAPRGWVALRLDGDSVDWDEVDDLLEESYRMTAPKKLVAELDASGGADSSSGR